MNSKYNVGHCLAICPLSMAGSLWSSPHVLGIKVWVQLNLIDRYDPFIIILHAVTIASGTFSTKIDAIRNHKLRGNRNPSVNKHFNSLLFTQIFSLIINGHGAGMSYWQYVINYNLDLMIRGPALSML